jgi:hypothetical protein
MGAGKITDVFFRKESYFTRGNGYSTLLQMGSDLLFIAGVPEYGFSYVYDHIIPEGVSWWG